jgi:flagellar motor switch protein FliM/N
MVVLGTSTMPIHQVLRLSRGAIIELDATEADEVKVLANFQLPITLTTRADPLIGEILSRKNHL